VFGCSLQGCKAVDPLKAERGVRQQPAALGLEVSAGSSSSRQQAAAVAALDWREKAYSCMRMRGFTGVLLRPAGLLHA
jgi:hypothetical protein